jgi:hypothetical protein
MYIKRVSPRGPRQAFKFDLGQQFGFEHLGRLQLRQAAIDGRYPLRAFGGACRV